MRGENMTARYGVHNRTGNVLENAHLGMLFVDFTSVLFPQVNDKAIARAPRDNRLEVPSWFSELKFPRAIDMAVEKLIDNEGRMVCCSPIRMGESVHWAHGLQNKRRPPSGSSIVAR
jgi:hypothetical protein